MKNGNYTPHTSTRYVNADGPGKKLPELYERKQSCCGCAACSSICPVKAISMEPDEEGFLYPVVDGSRCVRCYQCLSVCAFKQDQRQAGRDVR